MLGQYTLLESIEIIELLLLFCIWTTATCDPNPCENGGSCVLRSNSQVCMCLPGFTGGLCDTGKCMYCQLSVGHKTIDGLLLVAATRLLPYGALYGDLFVPNFDDGVSDAIPIPRGFRFFDRTHYKAYVMSVFHYLYFPVKLLHHVSIL